MKNKHNNLKELISPVLKTLGYKVVQVLSHEKPLKEIEISIERLDGLQITVSDCSIATLQISPMLDVANILQGDYYLTVASPGIDRPLVDKEDYTRFNGESVFIETILPINDKIRFRGKLKSFDGNIVVVEDLDGFFKIPFDEIKKARLDTSRDFDKKNNNRKQKRK